MRCIGVVFLLCCFSVSAANADSEHDCRMKDEGGLNILIDRGHSHVEPHTLAQKVIISQTQLRHSGAQTLREALQMFSGVQTQDLVGDGSQLVISLRGFGDNAAQNSLVLIDGIPISNADMGAAQVSLIPIEAIERIEITFGSEGVLYGNQAVGGVINVVTKTGKGEAQGGNFSFGNYQGKSTYAYLSRNYGHWQVYQSGKIYSTNNFRDHNRTNQGNLFGHVNYHYDTGDLALSYAFLRQYQLFAGALNAVQENENPQQSQTNTDFGRLNQLWIHLQHHQTFTPEWQIVTDIAERQDEGDFFLFSPFHQHRQNFFVQPSIRGDLKFLQIIFGTSESLSDYQLRSAVFSSTSAESRQSDAFIQTIFNLHPTWRFILGTRIAQQQSDFQAPIFQETHNKVLVTTAGIEHQLSQNLVFFLRRDGNFRFPKIDEEIDVLGNEIALETQKGTSYETGLKYNGGLFHGQLNLFQLDLEHEIAFDPTSTPLQPFGVNRNLEPTRRRGGTIGGFYQMTPNITLGANYTFVDARFYSGQFAGNQIPFVAKSSMETSVTYNLNSHWNIFLEAYHTGSRYPLGDDVNIGAKLSPVTLINVATSYQIGNFVLQSRVSNVTNHFYNAIATLQLPTNQTFFYPALGRSLWVTLGWNLNAH